MFKVTVKMASARPQGGKRRRTELEGPLHPKRLLGWAEWDSSYPDLTTQEPSSEQTVSPCPSPAGSCRRELAIPESSAGARHGERQAQTRCEVIALFLH